MCANAIRFLPDLSDVVSFAEMLEEQGGASEDTMQAARLPSIGLMLAPCETLWTALADFVGACALSPCPQSVVQESGRGGWQPGAKIRRRQQLLQGEQVVCSSLAVGEVPT